MNIYTICFLVMLIFNIAKNKNSIYILKYNQYNEENKYVKWMFKNPIKVFLTLDILPLITLIIAYVLNNNLSSKLVLVSIIFYLLELTRLLNNNRLYNNKRFIITKRIKRLIFTITVILGLPIIIFLIDRDNILFMLLIESIITYLSYFIVLIAFIINSPMENIINLINRDKAKEKIKKMENLKIIGVTGSTGKTTAINIISNIINKKYITKTTPKNLNTEKGIISTVNKYIDDSDQVFIVEMGAKKIGEIKKMNELINPMYGVVTNIDVTQYEVYDSPEKIINSKFELIEGLSKDGVAVLNKDDLKQVNYVIKNECKKVWIGIDNKEADIYATNIKMDINGTMFDVVINNKKHKFQTKLLGKSNIYSILYAIALGLEFCFKINELLKMVKELEVEKRKLEVIKYKYMYKIDDTYNKTPLGSSEALDILNNMDGEKIVVTSGFDGLNGKEKELNHVYGLNISKVSDYVILVNSKNIRKVFDGLLENNYDKNKIFVVNNQEEAYNLIRKIKTNKNIYALFEQI